jgi:hypothetical protein
MSTEHNKTSDIPVSNFENAISETADNKISYPDRVKEVSNNIYNGKITEQDFMFLNGMEHQTTIVYDVTREVKQLSGLSDEEIRMEVQRLMQPFKKDLY